MAGGLSVLLQEALFNLFLVKPEVTPEKAENEDWC